jgi:NAD(P)-dependent dehydrogenase (short-subunit alcohol dehydrogenase family)
MVARWRSSRFSDHAYGSISIRTTPTNISLTFINNPTCTPKMSVAIIQGASGGQGIALTSYILRHTGMKVYALTHGQGSAIKDHAGELAKGDRLTVIDGVDLKEERGLEDAAKMVKEREGKAAVRLIACFAGIVSLSYQAGAVRR